MYYLYIITGLALVISLIASRGRTLRAVKMAARRFITILPVFLIMLTLVSVVLFLVPENFIRVYLGVENKYLAVLLASLLGSLLIMPGFISFPLAGLLLAHLTMCILPANDPTSKNGFKNRANDLRACLVPEFINSTVYGCPNFGMPIAPADEKDIEDLEIDDQYEGLAIVYIILFVGLGINTILAGVAYFQTKELGLKLSQAALPALFEALTQSNPYGEGKGKGKRKRRKKIGGRNWH